MANLFSLVLMVCGSLSIIVFLIDSNLWINLYTGLIFWAVAFFNAALEFWQVYSSAKTLEGFLSLVPSTTLVLREGQLKDISAALLVVGDLIILKTGNKVPADARIIWSDNVRVDNSSLTGESEPQERNSACSDTDALEANNLLFSGTIMVSGEAVGLVVRVGPDTVIGRLAKYAVTEPKRPSQLEHEMTIFIRRLVAAALLFGILALILGFSLGLHVTDVIDAAVGIFVSFLPQGLPATMTILLTSAAKRMAARNVLVKELRSVETLGAMTLLATDKTGTLTQNKMAVVGGWIYGHIFNNVEEMDTSVGRIAEFLDSVSLCTSCKLDETEGGHDIEERSIFGDATEVGILRYVGKYRNLDQIFTEHPKEVELPFNSTTKWHAIVSFVEGQNRVILKGAPERVLEKCSRFRRDGEYVAIDDAFKDEFNRKYEYFAGNGLRILAVATKDLPSDQFPQGFKFEKDPLNFPLDNLDFLGFVCLRDPPKAGVQWAIGRLRDAGISVVMVTGDHPFTAEAISRQVGIISCADVFRRPPSETDISQRPSVRAAVIHGEDVDSMTKSDWRRVSHLHEIVFARTAPRHKLEIVKQFQAAGHIVAVSGDGVNDSPALRKANLGISMNKTASDVSKDAAHMILLDDNFVSIVAGVFEGRLIFENIKKSIRYTLTHITAEVTALLVYALLIIPPPLSPILLIFIDVFAELGPAVSFAGEPPEYDLMAVPPRQEVKTVIPIERRVGRFLRSWKVPSVLEKALVKTAKAFYLPNKGEGLIDTDLIIWSFLEGGIIVALGAWGAYVVTLAVELVPFGILYRSYLTYFADNSPALTLTDGTVASAEDQTVILGRLQAAYFQAILIAQWFNVFVQKHRYRYPWGKDLFVNRMTYIGIFCAMVVCAIVVYIPAINEVFQTNIPPALALAPPFVAGITLVLYEFVRRSLRHRGKFGGIPSPAVLIKPDTMGAEKAPPIPRSRELSVMERP
ncbi:HAD-like domain-containing protein [Paramicrosporidium saccamoebae]|uniref:HAD-like domain-containing protein n=1 Tax=Paramicrosporidium saccamoebae TaxID=1246581 RepID=A0A2H9TMP6_9FUNG|nr:HAD-like domain-containing protein [Paramicrosporidium saccamoebae]